MRRGPETGAACSLQAPLDSQRIGVTSKPQEARKGINPGEGVLDRVACGSLAIREPYPPGYLAFGALCTGEVEKQCACGKIFKTSSRQKETCSEDCARRRRKEIKHAYYIRGKILLLRKIRLV